MFGEPPQLVCVFRFIGEHGSKSEPDENLKDCRFIVENLKPATALEHFMKLIVASRAREHSASA